MNTVLSRTRLFTDLMSQLREDVRMSMKRLCNPCRRTEHVDAAAARTRPGPVRLLIVAPPALPVVTALRAQPPIPPLQKVVFEVCLRETRPLGFHILH